MCAKTLGNDITGHDGDTFFSSADGEVSTTYKLIHVKMESSDSNPETTKCLT